MVWNSHSQSWVFSLSEGFDSRDQLRPSRSAAMFGLDGRFHLLGMVVDALAAAAGISGFLGYGAVGSRQARGGIGDPVNEGYGAHGDGSSCVRVRSTTPHLRSIPSNIKADW